MFLSDPGHICGQGATLWCRNPLLSSKNFTRGHLMEIEWLLTDLTAFGSLDTAEHAILGMILARRFFGQFRTYRGLRATL